MTWVSPSVLATTVLLLVSAVAPAAAQTWKLEGTAAWQPRDSHAEFTHQGRLWIMGGWFQSHEAPPRDVWSSPDGKTWTRGPKDVPWIHSDLPMNTVFQGQMWVMGGWYNGRLPGCSASNQVWASPDGTTWRQVAASAGWTPRLAGGLVEFRGRLWVLGGTENYYFGNNASLKNDVWSSADGKDWRQETAAAPWAPRAYHQAVVLGGRIYVMGGGNYTPDYQAHQDVWSSTDGVNWRCETKAAPWPARLWFSAVTHRNRIWVLGGWSNHPSINHGDVWHSEDGREWQRLEVTPMWKERHEHSALVFDDKIWVLGGHARPLSNEVWSLSLPVDWKP